MFAYKVYVVSRTNKPLMPMKRFGKVRRLLKAGLARVIRRKPFTIQLLYDTTQYTQPFILGIDPGGKDIGYAVRKKNGELIEAGHLETRSVEVTENMQERQVARRSRRQHRREKRQRRAKKNKTCFVTKIYKITGMEKGQLCKLIQPSPVRFLHRLRESGWLTPTAWHLLLTHINFVKSIAKRMPIGGVYLEYAKFDSQKLDNPEIQGEEYQNGRKKGYANSHEYVLCRDKHTCQLCKKNNVLFQVHHVIWSSEGGADTPENLLTLCTKCHKRVHKFPDTDAEVKKIFAGLSKRNVHTTLLNSIMSSFHEWLLLQFGKVELTYGYETKEKRQKLGFPKDHAVDAYLISLPDTDIAANIVWNPSQILEYLQFRRHHRQLIHAIRDRNYKDDKKIVAKNRHKRTGQKQDSLTELVGREGKEILPKLRVLPGKKVIRSGFEKFGKGDVVRYKGKTYVVKGYGEMGRRIGFVGQKDYVLAKDCQLIVRNTGIVCL